MGKKGKTGKNRQDKFYHLAKEQGFRSRASFKLVQLNKRHDFLTSSARGVIDLCAAPGGWMQVARKHMPLHAPCIGIDLVPIRPVPGCIGIQGDITSEKARGDLRRALREANPSGDEKVDAVLNDGSPNMGKAWLQDAYTQSELTLAALKLATEFLAIGGCFVTKVFRSNDYNSLLFVMNQLFRRVNATKPAASRAESAEIYVMCIGYRAPKSIDPRLLNPKYVFQEMGKDTSVEKPDLYLNTVMKDMKKRKRNRGGYEDGDLILFKRISIVDYCRTTRPVAMMVESSQFSFDPKLLEESEGKEDSERVIEVLKNMPETTYEVESCCEDLKVLARGEFKLLLKWRVKARAALHQANLLSRKDGRERQESGEEGNEDEKIGDNSSNDESEDSGDEIDKEEKLIDEDLKKVEAEALAREKRKKRKANKIRNAVQRKIDMKIFLPEANGEVGNEAAGSLFSLKTATRAGKHGIKIDDVAVDDSNDADDEGSDDDDEKEMVTRLAYKVGGLKEMGGNENSVIEEDLDRWYKLYMSRKKRDKNGVLLEESKERKRLTKRRALREAIEKRATEGEEGKKEMEEEEAELVIDSSESSDEDMGNEDIHIGSKGRESREAALWFSQPMFEGMLGLSSDDEDLNEKKDENEEMEVEVIERVGEDIHEAAKMEARKMAKDRGKAKEENEDGFEVVEQEKNGYESESSFHSSDYDTDEKAEMVAIGKRMRESKREAIEVVDEAYNRYTFDDPIDLPRWFADADPTYRKRQAPVTKQQVAEMKEYIKSLQAAPTKKEAEAKARRKMRAMKKMEAMKAKANSIAEQGDVPASSRMRAIEDLYKQAMKKSSGGKKGKRKQYQVMKGNGRMNVGKNKVKGRKAMRGVYTTLVDKRMKSDKRGIAKANKRKRK